MIYYLRFMIIVCLLCGGIFFSGCSFGPSEQETANAYYGNFPDDYQKIIGNFARRITVDPDPNNTHLTFEEPIKGWMQNQRDPLARREFGWLVKTRINSKNRYGGYTGDQAWDFLIRDDRIVLIFSMYIEGYWAKPQNW